jgi:hypothetical protein
VYVDSVRRDLGGKVITGEAVERVVSRKVSYKYGSDSDWLWEWGCLNFEQGRHCPCNLTLWRVRVTIVAQMQQYVFLADFRYTCRCERYKQFVPKVSGLIFF